MQDEQFAQIKAINYWDERLPVTAFERSVLQSVIGYLGNQLIKVLVGQRRCGKSTILKQIILHLINQNIPKENILYLNFEFHALKWVNQDDRLAECIEGYFKRLKPTGGVYILLDELQEVDAWEKVLNGYNADDRYNVEFIITGSNAHLLSSEYATYVTGRYVEIAIFPFSFSEYCGFHAIEKSRDSLEVFIGDSGLPELFSLPDSERKIAYLQALNDSILMNDIVARFKINQPSILIRLLDFLIDNIGKLVSVNAIVNALNAKGVSVSSSTIGNYIHYLELTFLVSGVKRYDLRGKKILTGPSKYYLNDLGPSNYLRSTFDNHITRRLENFVYNELIQAGFQVYVGKIYDLEIDFVAERNKKKLFIQVNYLLHSEDVIAREYGNLEKLQNNWPKWVVSFDGIGLPSKEGIEHIQAWELQARLDQFKESLA